MQHLTTQLCGSPPNQLSTASRSSDSLRMGTQCFLVLTVLLWSQTEAEVVRSVYDCAQFFLSETPPQIPGVLENGQILDQNRYKPICQTYNNSQTFFTLYDTRNKIPVFSAYKFTGNEKGTRRPRDIKWMIEPQLEINMEIPGDMKKVYQKQASFLDYKNGLAYDRGHLFPSSHGFSQRDKNSTFTLTNIVPQAGNFNKGSWNKMENCTKCAMEKYCISNNNRIEGFLVTGAEPGNKLLNGKINIPSVMWSAFCCYSSRENKWLSSAHWGNNEPDLTKDQYLETKTLNQLYLKFRQTTSFKLFPQSQCPLHTTVTEFYPELNAESNNCNCPPTLTTTAPPTTTPPITTTQKTTSTTTTTTKQKDDHNKKEMEEVVKNVLTVGGVIAGGAVVEEVIRRNVDKAAIGSALRLLLPRPRPNLRFEIPLKTELKTSSVKLSPMKNSPVENSPVENTPVENSPADNSPVESLPVKDSPVENSPADGAFDLSDNYDDGNVFTDNVPDLSGDGAFEFSENYDDGSAPNDNFLDFSDVSDFMDLFRA